MLKRESIFPHWMLRHRFVVAIAVLAGIAIASPVRRLATATFQADNIIATTTLHSKGTTTSDGLIEAKAQIQVDGPSSTSSNLRTCNGNPNGSVIGSKGSICMDPTTPALWVNTNAATTWVQFGPVFTATSGGAVPASGGVATNFLNGAGGWTDPVAPISFGFGWFADGSDGNLVFDGTGTVTLLGGATIVPSAGVYVLPRNIHAADLTINAGVTVYANSYIIYVNGTGTINGVLEQNGIDSNSQTAGGAASDNYLPNAGLGGGNGATNGGGNTSGGNFNAGIGCTLGSLPAVDGAAINGGTCQGGTGGGVDASHQGGGTGTVALTSTQQGDIHDPWIGFFRGGTVVSAIGLPTTRWLTGTGGGGGGCNGSTFQCIAGGGGGSGGLLVAFIHTIAGTGAIRAKGGHGGDGGQQGTLGPAGGGGGGAGGFVFLWYVNGTPPTVDISGGAGGLGAHGGFNGGTGGNGLKFIYRLQ
jgi:hypothetical protein